MSYELAQKWAEFEIPKDIKAAYKAGVQLAGSLGFTKMMMFNLSIKTQSFVLLYMPLHLRW
jgi:hypothetical protein